MDGNLNESSSSVAKAVIASLLFPVIVGDNQEQRDTNPSSKGKDAITMAEEDPLYEDLDLAAESIKTQQVSDDAIILSVIILLLTSSSLLSWVLSWRPSLQRH